MTLASRKRGRDDSPVVSRDLSRALSAEPLAPTLQAAQEIRKHG
jgi:hypothetical protein